MPAPRFTLRRLLIGVTLFCAMMGLAVMFPHWAFWIGLCLLACAPAIAIAVGAMVVSNNRWRTLLVPTPGFLLSCLLAYSGLGAPGGIPNFILGGPLQGGVLMLVSALVDRTNDHPNVWPPK